MYQFLFPQSTAPAQALMVKLDQSHLRPQTSNSARHNRRAVMGFSVRLQPAQRNSAKAHEETYEVIKGQVRKKGMFTPEYRDDYLKGWIDEFESWERMYPHKYKRGNTYRICSQTSTMYLGDHQ